MAQASASNGEFSIADNGEANYKDYIDQLVAQIKREFTYTLSTPRPLC